MPPICSRSSSRIFKRSHRKTSRGFGFRPGPFRFSPGRCFFQALTFLLFLPPGGPSFALDVDILFVRHQIYGTQSRRYQKPYESNPDVRSDLFRLTADGELIRLTDLGENQGGVLDPCVSWDGTRVLFSMRRHRYEGWHIWEMSVNGSDLRQLTFDPPGRRVNDLDPIYLSGSNEIAFVSDRSSQALPGEESYSLNLYKRNLSTGTLVRLGASPGGEYTPTLGNDGRIYFNRYETLGSNVRGAVWSCNQDGTEMKACWGQYGVPNNSTVTGLDLLFINESPKPTFLGVFTSLERTMGKLGIFTLEAWVRDPEPEADLFPQDGRYQTPALIDSQHLLYSFDPDEAEGESVREDFGIYLDSIRMDNRIPVYNATETQEIDPVPVVERTVPPETPGFPEQGDESSGVYVCRDVTLRGDCRQPCASTPGLGDPALDDHFALSVVNRVRLFRPVPRRAPELDIILGGAALEMKDDAWRLAGEVPVAPDGSFAVRLPAGASFGFQLLGAEESALVQERTWLTLQPGETVTCGGCHEPNNGEEFVDRNAGNPPLGLDQVVGGIGTRTEFHTFVSSIRPLFTEKCGSCHGGEAPDGDLSLTTGRASYVSLLEPNFARVPFAYVMEGSARNSFLYQILTGNAYGQADHQNRIETINNQLDHTVLLSPSERKTVAVWLDTGAVFALLETGTSPDPPRVVTTLPADGTTDVPLNTICEILFSEPIDPNPGIQDQITLFHNGNPLAGEIEFPDLSVLRFIPEDDLPSSAEIVIQLATGIRDLDGTPLREPFEASFRTGTSRDATPPVTSSVFPSQSNPTSAVTGPFEIVFSEPIPPGEADRSRFRLLDHRGEEHPFFLSPSTDGKQVTVTPYPPLEPGQEYRVLTESPETDLSGNPADGTVEIEIRTADPLPPSALTIQADSFNTSAYEFDGQDLLVSGNGLWTMILQWNRNRLHWFWNPTRIHHSSLELARQPISIAANADRSRGYVLTRESARIQVVDLVSRSVLASGDLPTQRGWEISLSSDETRAFIAARDPDRVYMVDLVPESDSYLEVIGTATAASNHDRGRVWLEIHPSGNMLYMTGNRGLDLFRVEGNRIDWEGRFRANQYLGDCVLTGRGDQLLFINRDRGTVEVFDTAAHRTIAEMVLDFGAVSYWQRADDRIVLSPDDRFAVVAEEATGRLWILDRLTLRVVDRMEVGESITALETVAADGSDWLIHLFVRDRYHNRSRWLTLPGPKGLDGSPPSLVSTDPADGSTDVAVNRSVTLHFSEPMDRHSLSPETIRVLCSGCETENVTITVQIEPDNQIAHIIADGTWPLDADLEVRLHTGIRDLSGEPFQHEYRFTFRTAPTVPLPYLSKVADFSRVGTDANRLGIDPAGKWLITTDHYGDSVFVHDQQTLEFYKKIRVGDGPTAVVCPPGTGKAYISNTRENTLSVLDLNSLEIMETIEVDGGPGEAVLSRQGSSLYVVCSASDTILDIDVSTDTLRRRILPGEEREVQSITDAPDDALFLSGSYEIQVHRNSGVEVHPAPSGGVRILQMLLSSDGYQIFLRHQYRSAVYILDTVSWQWTDSIPTPTEPTRIVDSPDGRFLFVGFGNEKVVRVYDRLTTAQVSEFEVGGRIADLAFSEPDRRLFVLIREYPGWIEVFQMEDPADTTPPQVIDIFPWDGAEKTSVNTVVRVRFSEPADRNTVNRDTFHLVPVTAKDDISPVHAEVLLSRDNRTGFLVPDDPLRPGWEYRVALQPAIRDLSGNPLPSSVGSVFRVAEHLSSGLDLTSSATSSVAGSPYYVTTLTDGDPIVVSNYYSDTLSIHDPETLDEELRIDRGVKTGRALPIDGNRVWVSYPDRKEMVLINVNTGEPEDRFAYSLNRVDVTISGDRSTIAVLTGGNPAELVLASLSPEGTVSSTRTIPVSTWPRSVVLSPDVSYAYVVYSNRITILNLETNAEERTIAGSEWRTGGLMNDGTVFYGFEGNRGVLTFVHLPTGRRLTEIPVGNGPWNHALSPNGTILGVLDQDTDRILFLDVFTNDVLETYRAPEEVNLYALTFSPDGSKVYFTWDGPSTDGVTQLELGNLPPTPKPSPTRQPTTTPTPAGTPAHPFDVIADGKVDSRDLLRMLKMQTIEPSRDGTENLFLFALYWKSN